jgi:tricarballylate dehydrogenase
MPAEGATEEFDVVVVGGASAAFSAAVSARQHGARRVLMLEKSAENEMGGNARYSHTGFRFVQSGQDEVCEFLDVTDDEKQKMVIPAYSEEDFMADLQRVTRGRINTELARVLVGESNAAVHWMRDTGIKWEATHFTVIDGVKYFGMGHILNPLGGGLGQVRQWRRIADGIGGIDFRWESAVVRLIGTDQRIRGVSVSGPHGSYQVEAKAVVLCAGGFQANAAMRAQYLAQGGDLFKVRGSYHNTGEVLRAALELGARSAGHWSGAHASPIGGNAPEVGVTNDYIRYSYRYGITVNTLGLRFFDEGEANPAFTYAKTGWAVQNQPGSVAYQIYDQKALALLDRQYASQTPVEASTIEELAAGLKIPAPVLRRTIETFNASIKDDVAFDPTHPRGDGRATHGLEPPKSNWAVAIDEPPYRAYEVTGGITFTFGGLEIDTSARVINTRRRPIQGLFASGDIVGLFFHNYPACSGQTRNAVFGRIAGEGAATGKPAREGS